MPDYIMNGSKKFCLLTFGRAGSTALINALQAFDDIAVPNKNIDCHDNELLSEGNVLKCAHDYELLTGRRIGSVNELIECFYAHNADAPYCGFKSMPARHPDFLQFTSRREIRFITLVRSDIPSTVASFMLAMSHGTWRRDGGTPEQRWTFTRDQRNRVLGNMSYIMRSLALLQQVPNAIRLTYEGLCQADFHSKELDEYFGRPIKLPNPRPPTSGQKYVTNWEEFCGFINKACAQMG